MGAVELAAHAFSALMLIGSLLCDLAGGCVPAPEPVAPAIKESTAVSADPLSRTSGPAPQALRAFAVDEP